MELLRTFDTNIFFSINHLPHTWWSDMVGQMLSGFENAWIIWFCIGVILFIREERKDHWFVISSGIAGILTYMSETVLKYSVGRIRPSVLADVIVIGSVPQSFSFPSTHAVFAFACAYLFSEKEPRWRWWLYVLATFVCLSRIYLGHHYPIDVIGGILIGISIGYIAIIITSFFRKRR
jgi:undecaprenyl-diphosphatase